MELNFDPSRAFFKTDTNDPFTTHPIYVFDSNYLPDLSSLDLDKKEAEQLMVKSFKRIIARIPKRPYVLICFTSGFKNFNHNDYSWMTCLKCYNLLPEELKQNLKRAYMVHESWIARYINQFLVNVLNFKSFKLNKKIIFDKNNDKNDDASNDNENENIARIVYCNSLTELAKYVDITKIRISLEVYYYDLQLNDKLIVPYHIKSGSLDYINYQEAIYDRVVKRLLLEGCKAELVFTKPGNQVKFNILLDAIERANYIDISQWDIYVMGSLYMTILGTQRVRVIPIEFIELPIRDDSQYTFDTFIKILEYNDHFSLISKLVEVMINLLNNSENTKHDIKSLVKAVTPSLIQENLSMKSNDQLLIGQRFVKNLLVHWEEISYRLVNSAAMSAAPTESSTPAEVTTTTTAAPTKKPVAPTPPPSRKSKSKPTSSSNEGDEQDDAPRKPRKSVTISTEDNEFHPPIEADAGKDKHTSKSETPATLSDITLIKANVPSRQVQKPLLKFSEGYSSIQGQKKVNKLAKLYEERLIGPERGEIQF